MIALAICLLAGAVLVRWDRKDASTDDIDPTWTAFYRGDWQVK